MRVAVTFEQCWHEVPGGTATAAIETARAVRAQRPDVDQIGVSARHRTLAPPAWTPPVDVRPLPLPRLALYEAWHWLRWPGVERATGPVDVVHATGVAVPPHSAPLVVTVHDLAWRHEPDHFTRRGLAFFRRALALTIAEADLVLCSSHATLADCTGAGIDAERLRVVPLGVRSEPADPGRVAAVLRTYDLDRYVLWNGTIEPRKNLPTLIEAFRRLGGRDDVDLVLVGPDGWHEEVEGRIEGLDGRVRRLPFQSRADLAALHAGAAAFCYPSLREGFGLPVLDAMAQGTPVVTSAGTATEEVADGAALLVDPLDADALAGALRCVLDDPDVAARLSDAGRARAAEYTWERTAALTAAAYAEVAA